MGFFDDVLAPPETVKGGFFDDVLAPQKVAAPAERPKPQGMLATALEPIVSYPSTQAKMAQEGVDLAVEGGKQLGAGVGNVGTNNLSAAKDIALGAGKAALGGVGYVTSPLSAAVRTILGKPVEDLTGIPKEYTEFAASLALPGVGMTKIGSTRVLSPTSPATQEAVQAAGRLSQTGAPVTVPKFIASDSPSVGYIAQGVRNVPVGGTPIVRATENAVGQLGDKADEISTAYGGSSVAGSGANARQSIVDWIGPESKASIGKAYDAVDQAINPNVTTELTNTRQVAQDILSRRTNAGIQGDGGAVGKVIDAATRPGGLNYAGIKDLRSNLGEAISSNILPEGMSPAEVKQVYGALSKDLATSVESAGGPQAKTLWERANKYNALVNDRREALAKIVGTSGDAPAEQVFDRLSSMASSSSRADVGRLAQARKVIGADGWNDVTSAVVGRLGRDAQGEFSPARFVTEYGKFSDEGKSLLFRSGGKSDLAQSLDDIATISARWKDNYKKFGNPSGTAQNLSFAALGAGLLAEPITTISTVVGSRAMATVLSRPATASASAQFARRYQVAVQAPTAATVANLSVSARNLANTVNSQLGLSTKADDFLRAIQGAVPARSEDNQPEADGIINK